MILLVTQFWQTVPILLNSIITTYKAAQNLPLSSGETQTWEGKRIRTQLFVKLEEWSERQDGKSVICSWLQRAEPSKEKADSEQWSWQKSCGKEFALKWFTRECCSKIFWHSEKGRWYRKLYQQKCYLWGSGKYNTAEEECLCKKH